MSFTEPDVVPHKPDYRAADRAALHYRWKDDDS